MNSVNLSPANQVLVQQKQQVVTNPQIEAKPKQIKNGKKLIIAGAAAAAALGAAAILIATHKSHKAKGAISKTIQNASDEILEKSQKMHDEAQSVVDEVMQLFDKGKASNFADVLDENGNTIVKYDLNSEGKLKSIIQTGVEGFKERIGRFDDDLLSQIETKNSDGLADLINLEDSKISVIMKGIEELTDGSRGADELFMFDDGKLVCFSKNFSEDYSIRFTTDKL